MLEDDCGDVGYSLISDGCIPCQTWNPGDMKPTRPVLVKDVKYGRVWWVCPICHASYGEVQSSEVSICSIS